ncbi:MAG TPA: DUF433 domain-containing protein [Pyrinomonadaceae bacterium]
MSTTVTAHIEVDEYGVAWIDDTKVKVIEVVIDRIAHGSSPEEIHFQYPHLSLAQIHAALAYYYDNQAPLDAEIGRRREEADALAEEVSDSSLRQKLLEVKRARTEIKYSVAVYRKGMGRDVWHWCRSCTGWPANNYEETSSRPTAGGLCNECHAKQAAGNCRE